jgi:hypothetical protein
VEWKVTPEMVSSICRHDQRFVMSPVDTRE